MSHLLIIDSNPVFTAPANLGFAEALEAGAFSLALANHADETARSTTWFVPKTHDWESWSDARAYDGTVTILQPQALPLYGGTSAHELLALYLDSTPGSSEALVRATWAARFGENFAKAWHDALADGVVSGTASAKSDVRLRADAPARHPRAQRRLRGSAL